MTPRLWTEDLDGALKWIKETISQSARGQLTDFSGEAQVAVSSESVGMARVWLGPTVPDGWLRLDGSYVFITEASDLYVLLGSAAGGSPPAGMFKLPLAPSALASGFWIIKK